MVLIISPLDISKKFLGWVFISMSIISRLNRTYFPSWFFNQLYWKILICFNSVGMFVLEIPSLIFRGKPIIHHPDFRGGRLKTLQLYDWSIWDCIGNLPISIFRYNILYLSSRFPRIRPVINIFIDMSIFVVNAQIFNIFTIFLHFCLRDHLFKCFKPIVKIRAMFFISQFLLILGIFNLNNWFITKKTTLNVFYNFLMLCQQILY